MSREIAAGLFIALCLAEVVLRVAHWWEHIGRAACPCGGEL